MKNVHLLTNTLFAVACALLIGTKTFAEPMNLDALKKELKTYHDSGAYQKEVEDVLKKARAYITSQVAINNQAKPPKKLAVVLDIDDTSLTNYQDIVERNFNDDKKLIQKSISRGDTPPLTPMLALYNDMLQQQVAVFFVTGRNEQLKTVTERNLKAAGYKGWSGVYFRPKNYNAASIVPYKTQARVAITQMGYTIIASIGDQKSDIEGDNIKRGFKLPNPYYYLP